MYLQPDTTTSVPIIRQQGSDVTEHRWGESTLTANKGKRAARHHVGNLKKSDEFGRGGQDAKYDSIGAHEARSALQRIKASSEELILIRSAATGAVYYDDAVRVGSLTL